MNSFQKVTVIATAFALLFFVFNYSVGTLKYVVTVKYNDNLVEYRAEPKELNDLLLKSNNNCLFFDGETFFEQAPSHAIRNFTRVNILDHKAIVCGGDYTKSQYIFTIVIIFIVGLVFFAGGTIDSSEDYDGY